MSPAAAQREIAGLVERLAILPNPDDSTACAGWLQGNNVLLRFANGLPIATVAATIDRALMFATTHFDQLDLRRALWGDTPWIEQVDPGEPAAGFLRDLLTIAAAWGITLSADTRESAIGVLRTWLAARPADIMDIRVERILRGIK
jgi:hypothetical protein